MLAPPRAELEVSRFEGELPAGTYGLLGLQVGSRIVLEELARQLGPRVEETGQTEVSKTELAVRFPDEPHSRAYVFGHGSLVFFNVRPESRQAFLAEVESSVAGDRGGEFSDDYVVEYRPGTEERVEFGRAVLSTASPKKLKLVARIMAQSISLERFELRADQLLERAAEITETLAVEGKIPRHTKDLLRFIGVALSTRRQIVTQLSLLDPPEEIWDDPSLDNLYHKLHTNFELQVRFRALEYKLELIEEAVEVVTDLHDTRRGHMLELIVIILIALEVFFALFVHN